jgi:rod shape-determining protein MreD
MAILLAFPILSVLLIFQTAIISQITLLQGKADIILLTIIAWALQKRVKTAWHWCIIGGLMVSFVSGMPLGAWIIGYFLAVGLALVFRQRIWQVPVLAMFVATFFGTVFTHLVSLAALRVMGTSLPFFKALNLVTLPSILLNFLLVIPIYALFSDLAKWIYPEKLEM